MVSNVSPFLLFFCPFSPFFHTFLPGTPIVAMFVQLAIIGETGKDMKGGKDRTMLKILFITPEEIGGTLMTVGPEPSLFVSQKNKRPIYLTTHQLFVQISYAGKKTGKFSQL